MERVLKQKSDGNIDQKLQSLLLEYDELRKSDKTLSFSGAVRFQLHFRHHCTESIVSFMALVLARIDNVEERKRVTIMAEGNIANIVSRMFIETSLVRFDFCYLAILQKKITSAFCQTKKCY